MFLYNDDNDDEDDNDHPTSDKPLSLSAWHMRLKNIHRTHCRFPTVQQEWLCGLAEFGAGAHLVKNDHFVVGLFRRSGPVKPMASHPECWVCAASVHCFPHAVLRYFRHLMYGVVLVTEHREQVQPQ